MADKFLVQSIVEGVTYSNLLDKSRIISSISMKDCTDEEISVYDVSE